MIDSNGSDILSDEEFERRMNIKRRTKISSDSVRNSKQYGTQNSNSQVKTLKENNRLDLELDDILEQKSSKRVSFAYKVTSFENYAEKLNVGTQNKKRRNSILKKPRESLFNSNY